LRCNWLTVGYKNMAIVWGRFDAFGVTRWWWTKKRGSELDRNKNWYISRV